MRELIFGPPLVTFLMQSCSHSLFMNWSPDTGAKSPQVYFASQQNPWNDTFRSLRLTVLTARPMLRLYVSVSLHYSGGKCHLTFESEPFALQGASCRSRFWSIIWHFVLCENHRVGCWLIDNLNHFAFICPSKNKFPHLSEKHVEWKFREDLHGFLTAALALWLAQRSRPLTSWFGVDSVSVISVMTSPSVNGRNRVNFTQIDGSRADSYCSIYLANLGGSHLSRQLLPIEWMRERCTMHLVLFAMKHVNGWPTKGRVNCFYFRWIWGEIQSSFTIQIISRMMPRAVNPAVLFRIGSNIPTGTNGVWPWGPTDV